MDAVLGKQSADTFPKTGRSTGHGDSVGQRERDCRFRIHIPSGPWLITDLTIADSTATTARAPQRSCQPAPSTVFHLSSTFNGRSRPARTFASSQYGAADNF
jgi:hypothetical protein